MSSISNQLNNDQFITGTVLFAFFFTVRFIVLKKLIEFFACSFYSVGGLVFVRSKPNRKHIQNLKPTIVYK